MESDDPDFLNIATLELEWRTGLVLVELYFLKKTVKFEKIYDSEGKCEKTSIIKLSYSHDRNKEEKHATYLKKWISERNGNI